MKKNNEDCKLSQSVLFKLGMLKGVMMKMDESLLDYICLEQQNEGLIEEDVLLFDVSFQNLYQRLLNVNHKFEFLQSYLIQNEWIIRPINFKKVIDELDSYQSFIQALDKCIDEYFVLIDRIEQNVRLNIETIRKSLYNEATKNNLIVLYDYFKTHQKSDVSNCALFMNVSYNTAALLVQSLEDLGMIQLLNKQRRNKLYSIILNLIV